MLLEKIIMISILNRKSTSNNNNNNNNVNNKSNINLIYQ